MTSPLRFLAVCPVLVLITAAAGLAIVHAAGLTPRLGEALAACGICLAAGEMALTPMLLSGEKQDARIRAALVGTAVHLGIVLILGILMISLLKPTNTFVFWLLAEYWVTLIGLCSAFVFLMQTHPPADPRLKPPAAD